MDGQDPPNRPRYQLTRGLIGLDSEKRRDDVILTRQEVCTRRHLANVHSVTGPAGIVYRMTFSVVWRDRSCRLVKQLSIG